MSDDTTFQRPDTNQEQKDLGGTEPISEDFRRKQELEARIADASPQAQTMIDELRKLESSRLQQEEKSQTRSREFRVLREKDRLVRDYFANPQPIPNEPQAKQLAYQTIADQAERTVAEKEAYYKGQITRDAEANIRDVLRRDHAEASRGHGQHQSEREPEHGDR